MIKRYRLTLIKLFEQIHRIQAYPDNNLGECLNLQEALIKKITYIERRIRQRKTYIKRIKQEFGNKDSKRLSKEDAQNAKERLSLYHYQIDQYQTLIYTLKLIGDSLAFTYINKWDIKPLSFKRPPGFISGKKGLRLERKILRSAFSNGHVALLNDVTNCLRYGDITVPKQGKFIIFEAKSGKRGSEKDKKQLHDLTQILEYLYTDRTDNLYQMEGDFRRVNIMSPEVNHVEKLNEIVHQALDEGQEYSQVEDGLYYIATTKFDPNILSDINNKRIGHLISCVLNATNTVSTYYPIMLTLNDPQALYRFFLGELEIIVVVDMGIIEQQLDEYNLTIKFSLDNPSFFATITNPNVKRDEEFQYIKISHVFWSRLYYEFLSLNWYIREIAQVLITNQLALNL